MICFGVGCKTAKLFKKKIAYCERFHSLHFYRLYPSTKRAITAMSFEQIEKCQCLKLSTTQGLQHGNIRIYVARVTCPET